MSSSADVERLLQAARLHLAQGELHDAVKQATEAIRLNAKEPAAYLVRAEAHRRLNRPDRAVADLAVAIRLDSNQPGPYVIRAQILLKRCLFDQAIADATNAIILDARNAAAYSIRAECRSAIGDKEGATEDVHEMLRIDPTRSIPDLRARSVSGDPSPAVASDDERFWKQSGETITDDERAMFADGKPVDKTYRSRRVVSDDDAPETLGVASGYKPETIGKPLPRIRARQKGPQVSLIVVGLVCLGLLGGGYMLINLNRSPQDTKPISPPSQSTESLTAAKTQAEPPATVAMSPQADPVQAQSPATAANSPVVPPTVEQKKAPTLPSPATNVPSIENIRGLEGHTGAVVSVAFSPDGEWLASASFDSTVRLWRVAEDQADNTHITLATSTTDPPKQFNKVAFSLDGKWLAASNQDGRIFLWDASKMPPRLQRILKKHKYSVWAIAFNPDGKTLATGDLDSGTVNFWDLTDLQVPIKTTIPPENNGMWWLAYSPDGKYLYESPTIPEPEGKPLPVVIPPQIWVWDVSHRPYIKTSILRSVRSGVSSLVVSPDGSNIAFGDGDFVQVLDPKTGRQVRTFEKHTGFVRSVAYTPDGRYLLSGAKDRTARLWDTMTGEQVLYVDEIAPIWCGAISPDGHLIALASADKVIKLVRLRSVEGRQAR